MQREEHRNSYLRDLKGSLCWQTVCHFICVDAHLLMSCFFPPNLTFSKFPPILYLSLSALSCLASLFSPSPLLSMKSVALPCALMRENQAAHSSRVICVPDSWKCALVSSLLSPLTATSPLCHRQVDQILTAPSCTLVDKWKVVEGSVFIGLVRVDQDNMKWKNVPSWSWGLFTINP